MNPIDILLSSSLSGLITTNLGKKTVQRIENRLKERYEITFDEAMRDFQKIDATLREFFGSGADNIERKFLNQLISIDKKENNSIWVTIEEQSLAKLILESFGDPQKKIILDASLQRPEIIQNLLDACNIPKSSGYRLIKDLIDDGLLTKRGFDISSDGKKINRYTTPFKNIKIDIDVLKQKTRVQVQINEEFVRESFLIRLLHR